MTKLPCSSVPHRPGASIRLATGLLAGDLPRLDKTTHSVGRTSGLILLLRLRLPFPRRLWTTLEADQPRWPPSAGQQASPARGDRVSGGVLGGCVRLPLCCGPCRFARLTQRPAADGIDDAAVEGVRSEGVVWRSSAACQAHLLVIKRMLEWGARAKGRRAVLFVIG